MPSGACLDTGALLAVERGDRRVLRFLELLVVEGGTLEITAGVIAQSWRDGARQARIAKLLGSADVVLVDLDADTARAVAVMCGRSGVSDVVDGHVALHARRRGLTVVTSDPEDIAALDPSLTVIAV